MLAFQLLIVVSLISMRFTNSEGSFLLDAHTKTFRCIREGRQDLICNDPCSFCAAHCQRDVTSASHRGPLAGHCEAALAMASLQISHRLDVVGAAITPQPCQAESPSCMLMRLLNAQACPWLGISVWDLRAAAKNQPSVLLDVMPTQAAVAADIVAIAFEQLPWDGCPAALKHAELCGTRLALLTAQAQVRLPSAHCGRRQACLVDVCHLGVRNLFMQPLCDGYQAAL